MCIIVVCNECVPLRIISCYINNVNVWQRNILPPFLQLIWNPYRFQMGLIFCENQTDSWNRILCSRLLTSKDNMEYLQHDYILTWTAYEPLILWLSCNKWSCGTYQNCWTEWNALIRQRCYRESTHCKSTDTERHNVGQY